MIRAGLRKHILDIEIIGREENKNEYWNHASEVVGEILCYFSRKKATTTINITLELKEKQCIIHLNKLFYRKYFILQEME